MKNVMYMLGGVGVGLLASKYGKDIKKEQMSKEDVEELEEMLKELV